jgi:5-methylcytosine-specific restriction protein A
MPNAQAKPCSIPTCRHTRPCPVHGVQPRTRVYNQGNWRAVSHTYLQAHPFCVHCRAQHRITLATCVDHIRDHLGDGVLFWDRDNWQALCASCHSRKTRATSC